MILYTRKRHIPFVVDDECVDIVSKFTWSTNGAGQLQTKLVDGTLTKLHILLFGSFPDKRWEFINGDQLDNRRENLRLKDKIKKYDEKIIGIYAIRNLITNKMYIGSSNHIYRRWKFQRDMLRANIGKNIRLQQAWNSDGEQAFELQILGIVDDPNDLIDIEQWFIDNNDCYNIRPAGNRAGSGHTGRAKFVEHDY